MKFKPTTALVIMAALLAVACIPPAMPGPITNFASGGNGIIAEAIELAAADWARHGLEIANYVTIDDEGQKLPVRFATAEEIQTEVGEGNPPKIGITVSKRGEWKYILLDERLENDPEKLAWVMRHELIHALVPSMPHLEGLVGITTGVHTSPVITRADMEHLARYTDVGPASVPFAGEAA